MAFFDVRVFNPNISKTYKLNEKEKKRLYSERITEIKHGSFTPLVMSATGGMPPSMKLHQEVSPKCVNEESSTERRSYNRQVNRSPQCNIKT